MWFRRQVIKLQAARQRAPMRDRDNGVDTSLRCKWGRCRFAWEIAAAARLVRPFRVLLVRVGQRGYELLKLSH
jgi:hypothetical protein